MPSFNLKCAKGYTSPGHRQELKGKTGELLKITENFEEYLDLEGYSQEVMDSLVEKIEYFPDRSLMFSLNCSNVYEDMVMLFDAEKEGGTAPALLQAELQVSMNPAN